MGIHAANCRDVERKLRPCRPIIRFHRSDGTFGRNLVPARDHIEFAGMNFCVNRYRLRNDLGVVSITVIQALTFDIDSAAINIEAFELAVFNQRLSGGQRIAAGVDKSATVTGNA